MQRLANRQHSDPVILRIIECRVKAQQSAIISIAYTFPCSQAWATPSQTASATTLSSASSPQPSLLLARP